MKHLQQQAMGVGNQMNADGKKSGAALGYGDLLMGNKDIAEQAAKEALEGEQMLKSEIQNGNVKQPSNFVPPPVLVPEASQFDPSPAGKVQKSATAKTVPAHFGDDPRNPSLAS